MDELPLGDDFDEDPFYQQEHKPEDYGDVEQVFKSTAEKQGLDPSDINLNIDESFYNTVILSVLNKFNSAGTVPQISGFLK